jgi:hypothetical protein
MPNRTAQTETYDHTAVRTFLVPTSAKGSALVPVHVAGCVHAPIAGTKTLERSSLDEILAWWRATPCACWPTAEPQAETEDGIEAREYATLDNDADDWDGITLQDGSQARVTVDGGTVRLFVRGADGREAEIVLTYATAKAVQADLEDAGINAWRAEHAAARRNTARA